ncbi:type VII secretion target [Rhizocola hellebori]|nr:type VII secretion target [Rhizocola hellebori]
MGTGIHVEPERLRHHAQVLAGLRAAVTPITAGLAEARQGELGTLEAALLEGYDECGRALDAELHAIGERLDAYVDNFRVCADNYEQSDALEFRP